MRTRRCSLLGSSHCYVPGHEESYSYRWLRSRKKRLQRANSELYTTQAAPDCDSVGQTRHHVPGTPEIRHTQYPPPRRDPSPKFELRPIPYHKKYSSAIRNSRSSKTFHRNGLKQVLGQSHLISYHGSKSATAPRVFFHQCLIMSTF